MKKPLKNPTFPTTINSKELASIANLTERRLRQLAEQGRLPAPKKGQWPAADTLRGLFKFYQSLPEEYSRERVLKLAAQRKRAELQLATDERKMIPKSEVAQAIARLIGPAVQSLRTHLIEEYPSTVAGLDVPEAQVYGGKLYDRICEAMAALGREFDAL